MSMMAPKAEAVPCLTSPVRQRFHSMLIARQRAAMTTMLAQRGVGRLGD